jgi:molybdate transport system substrate-binding protein
MRLSIVLSVVCLFLGLAQSASADDVNIYAAASTADAIDDILAAYRPPAGSEVVATYAASSTLARQIDAGAPADLYLSANETWMDDLQTRQRLAAGSRVNLLTNELVLVAPRMLPLTYEPSAGPTLAETLDGGRLAIGDPDGVPAGIYAREALTALGEWDAVQDDLVYGDSVRAALTWAARAEVRAAIVYASDTYSTISVVRVATFPEGTHTPIRYPLAMVSGSEERPEVLAFYEYLRGAQAREIFEAYGFGSADED